MSHQGIALQNIYTIFPFLVVFNVSFFPSKHKLLLGHFGSEIWECNVRFACGEHNATTPLAPMLALSTAYAHKTNCTFDRLSSHCCLSPLFLQTALPATRRKWQHKPFGPIRKPNGTSCRPGASCSSCFQLWTQGPGPVPCTPQPPNIRSLRSVVGQVLHDCLLQCPSLPV